MNQRHVLLLGDIQEADFCGPLAWLQAHTCLHLAQSQAEAIRWLRREDGAACEAIVLAQARPGSIQSLNIETLHATAPLARLILLLGTWCEGESRTSRLPPGVLQVYWHQFIARAEREWLSSQNQAGMWTLSRTSHDNDQLLAWRHSLSQRTGLVAIRTDSLIAYECLAEMCGLGGWATTWLAPRQPVHLQRTSVLLWDVSAAKDADIACWKDCHSDLGPRASILLMGFPRREDVQQLCQAGAAAVLAKPLVIADLLNMLDRATSASHGGDLANQRRAG